MEVGSKIKKYLEDNGISQTFLSKKTGIELPKLNLALNGNRKLTFTEYELICGALNVEAGAFLEPRLPEVKGV
nr:helix-turn-helix transcriptional regulator [uncultured Marvinbryantia sp.]